jgi:hypothetical protein
MLFETTTYQAVSQDGSKALPMQGTRNGPVQSWDESKVRGGEGPNKPLLANSGMVMIKNLIYSFVVPPCTFGYLPLRAKESYGSAPESGLTLDTVNSNTSYQDGHKALAC